MGVAGAVSVECRLCMRGLDQGAGGGGRRLAHTSIHHQQIFLVPGRGSSWLPGQSTTRYFNFKSCFIPNSPNIELPLTLNA